MNAVTDAKIVRYDTDQRATVRDEAGSESWLQSIAINALGPSRQNHTGMKNNRLTTWV